MVMEEVTLAEHILEPCQGDGYSSDYGVKSVQHISYSTVSAMEAMALQYMIHPSFLFFFFLPCSVCSCGVSTIDCIVLLQKSRHAAIRWSLARCIVYSMHASVDGNELHPIPETTVDTNRDVFLFISTSAV